MTEEERFWAKVDVRGPDECWLWVGATKGRRTPGKERGQLTVKRGEQWKNVTAHVLAWEHKNGPPPAGLCVCHRCDIGLCVNDRHLFLGTIADNNRDMIEKRRHQYGVRHWNARLCPDDIRLIRAMATSGSPQREIAVVLGIGQPHVHKILAGKAWKLTEQRAV
jgi:hypothetical protein